MNASTRSELWPADNPAVIAHMNLLQGIINRLANNSASCKTWCLTLVGALLSLAGATHVPGLVTFALVPVIVFGFLDTLYLAQEKQYRDLYGEIRTAIVRGTYSLSDAFRAGAPLQRANVRHAFFSWSIYPLYWALILLYLIADTSGGVNMIAKTGP